MGCSSTITEKRHEDWAAADPMAECLLGGTALRGVGGCAADSRRALVFVAGSTSVMGGLGPQRPLYWLASSGSLSSITVRRKQASRSARTLRNGTYIRVVTSKPDRGPKSFSNFALW